ncbi:MAG: DUF1294 domain-containing protein [Verrucomicrobiota bacterium]
MKTGDLMVLGWIGIASVLSFVQFGWDKRLAVLSRRRISEMQLIFLAAVGGWPGALLGMHWFRHKTAKTTFLLKFALASVIFTALCFFYLRWRFSRHR